MRLINRKTFNKKTIIEYSEFTKCSEKDCVSAGIYKENTKKRRFFNKKGSSLILALVAISLIAILSTLVLSLALNAYKASVQNKWADEDFYYCEECLEDVYGVVVATTNDIFLDNYKKVLTMFTKEDSEIINEAFYTSVYNDLQSINGNRANTVYLALTKNIDATDEDGNVVGEIKVSYKENYLQDIKSGRFVFKNVKVEFFNSDRTLVEEKQKKFYASVTTDIVIYIPKLAADVETDTKGSLDYIIVSGENTLLSGNSTIKGNIYTGTDFEIDKNANINLLSDYITVCNQLKNNGKLSVSGFSATSNIWCKDFILKENSSSSVISGNLFVNDDMEINGKNCSVQLAGKYYGYGDGSSTTGYTEKKGSSYSSMNSAILVNGEGTLLDMVNIDELVISGHSFFPVEGNNVQYKGSESLATIVAQSIYMVDDDYIDFVNRKVTIGNKTVEFEDIKLQNGKSLIDLLTTDGYTLVTGGVDLDDAKINIDGTLITPAVFANQYIEEGVFVTLGYYEVGGEKYCSLYWNFKRGNTLKDVGADIVHGSYITNGFTQISMAGVVLDDLKLILGGTGFVVDGREISVKDVHDRAYSITDSHGHTHEFSMKYGNPLPNGVDVATFKSKYLVESDPVKAVIVSTASDDEEVFNYNLYLQWNFDPNKNANKNAGDIFISACIKAGLVDGFLEKFMDGGYIKIADDANVGTVTDLYEYLVGEGGYVAKEYGANTEPLFHTSVFAKNFADTYKWYMTTLIPEEYNPFGTLKPFNETPFNNNAKYSIFNRISYYYVAGAKINTNYMNFETIDTVLSGGYEIVSSMDEKYKNMIVDGDLIVDSRGSWKAGGRNADPFLHGIIFVNGNVKIDGNIDFKGLIIANGKVEISAGNYTNDVKTVENCLEALKSDRHSKWWSLVSDEFYTKKSDNQMATSTLNADKCIKYENWTRNRD